MEFSVSMDASPRPQIDPRAPLFASVMGAAADLGGGECVFRSQDGQTHVMTHQVLQALDRCRAFLSLSEHTQAVRQTLPNVPTEGIARVLESLVARRLLVSEQDFVAGLVKAAQAEPPRPMQMLIRGGAEAAGLPRLLASLAESGDWRPRIERVQVLWEAGSPESRSACLTAARTLAERAACRVDFVDALDLRNALRQQCGKDARQIAAAELVYGVASGGEHHAWNLALALAGGQRCLLLDEQMQWPLRISPRAVRGLELHARDRTSAWFFADPASALADAADPDTGERALSAHLDACGSRLGVLLDRDGWRAGDLRGRALAECLSTAGTARIAATLSGTRGFHRGVELEDLFLLDAVGRGAFAADRDAYLRQLGRGSAWHGVDRAQLVRRGSVLPLTVDASGFLPFALHYGGAPGWTFSSMLQLVSPDSLMLQLPDSIGVAGAPAEIGREIGKRARSRGPGQFVADYLAARVADIQASTPATRMQTAAALLQDLAASSDGKLDDQVSEYVQYLRSDLIGKLQAVAEAAGKEAPVHWLADLRALITVNGRALIDTASARLSAADGTDAGNAALRQQLVQTANAMSVWPLLWERIQSGELRALVRPS